jgi:hypothetical protein
VAGTTLNLTPSGMQTYTKIRSFLGLALVEQVTLCYVNLQAYTYSTRLVLAYWVQSKIRCGLPMNRSSILSTFQNISLLSKAP